MTQFGTSYEGGLGRVKARDEMMLPYPQFCDANYLKRIDATPEEHLANLDKMATAVLELRKRYQSDIERRCPHCAGTGKT